MSKEQEAPQKIAGETLDPRMKKWYILQFAGGVVAAFGILSTTYYVAQSVQQGKGIALTTMDPILMLVGGLILHFMGRLMVRRLR